MTGVVGVRDRPEFFRFLSSFRTLDLPAAGTSSTTSLTTLGASSSADKVKIEFRTAFHFAHHTCTCSKPAHTPAVLSGCMPNCHPNITLCTGSCLMHGPSLTWQQKGATSVNAVHKWTKPCRNPSHAWQWKMGGLTLHLVRQSKSDPISQAGLLLPTTHCYTK